MTTHIQKFKVFKGKELSLEDKVDILDGAVKSWFGLRLLPDDRYDVTVTPNAETVYIKLYPKDFAELVLDGARQRDFSNAMANTINIRMKNIWFFYENRKITITLSFVPADDYRARTGYLVTDSELEARSE